jgi:hypothetical protein
MESIRKSVHLSLSLWPKENLSRKQLGPFGINATVRCRFIFSLGSCRSDSEPQSSLVITLKRGNDRSRCLLRIHGGSSINFGSSLGYK